MKTVHSTAGIGVDEAIAWLARLQHGVMTRTQLLAIGVSPKSIQTRLERGALLRMVPAVYAVPATPTSFEQSAMIALLDAGPGTCIAGFWAAAWWELGIFSFRNTVEPVVLLAPLSARARVANSAVRRSAFIAKTDIVAMTTYERDRTRLEASERRRVSRGGYLNFRRGLDRPRSDPVPPAVASVVVTPMVTSPVRTIVDLLRVVQDRHLTDADLERIVDEALAGHLVSADELTRCAERSAPSRAPGRTRLLRHLSRIGGGYVAPDSELERVGRAAFAEWGCPPPEPQIGVPGRTDQPGQVDFGWPTHRVVIEVDGRTHLTEEQIEKDRARDRGALLAGWRPFRYGWTDFHRHSARTRKEVRAIFGMK